MAVIAFPHHNFQAANMFCLLFFSIIGENRSRLRWILDDCVMCFLLLDDFLVLVDCIIIQYLVWCDSVCSPLPRSSALGTTPGLLIEFLSQTAHHAQGTGNMFNVAPKSPPFINFLVCLYSTHSVVKGYFPLDFVSDLLNSLHLLCYSSFVFCLSLVLSSWCVWRACVARWLSVSESSYISHAFCLNDQRGPRTF